MSYDTLWQEMEGVPGTGQPGQLRRRIRPESNFDIFIGLEQPTKYRTLVLSVSVTAVQAVSNIRPTRAIEVHINQSRASDDRATLELRLIDSNYLSVFSVLVSDIVDTIVLMATDKEAVIAFLARLDRWLHFLERVSLRGLSDEAQLGLYGELWFLRHHLVPVAGVQAAILSWLGPEAAPQDFKLRGCAVEIKATAARSPTQLAISNEYQLDDSGLDVMFILHLSTDVHVERGETLPAMIGVLRDMVSQSSTASALFAERLLAAGYIDEQQHFYHQTGYSVRKAEFFHVKTGFPRLIGSNLPDGVGNVQYAVTIADCSSFVVDSNFVINAIKGFL